MNNIDGMTDLQLTEERADMDSNAMDLALEQFFNNVLECINLEEDEKDCVLKCIH